MGRWQTGGTRASRVYLIVSLSTTHKSFISRVEEPLQARGRSTDAESEMRVGGGGKG